MIRLILSLILSSALVLSAQDSTKSQVIKSNKPRHKYPLVKPVRPSYPLLAGYMLQQEAKKGDPLAQHELGLRYLLGIGFKKDTVEAVKWIKRASEKGLAAAEFNYGIMCSEGVGVDWNPFEAFKNFRKAAGAGMPEAQYAYGINFTESFVVNKNLNESYKWVKKSAEAGYKPAEETLKKLKEFGVHPDDSDSAEQIIPIENNSISNSSALLTDQMELDYFEFALDTMSTDKSDSTIKELLNKDKEKLKRRLGISAADSSIAAEDTSGLGILFHAAEFGSPEALLMIARMYETGIGVKTDSVSAAANYIRAYRLGAYKAAEQLMKLIRNQGFYAKLKSEVDSNSAKAQYVWSAISALGLDYSITSEQSFEFMKKSAESGYLPAIIEMGLIYFNGTIKEKDLAMALKYWNKAVDLGSSEAEVRKAFLIANSEEDKLKKEEAVRKLIGIADEGSVLAQAALAYCYEKGIGIKKDKAKAAKLYRSAMYRGSEAAYNSLKRMYDELRPDEDEFVIYRQ